jgi:hypothetical protein
MEIIIVSGLLNPAARFYSKTLPFQLLHQKNGATQEAFGYAVAGAGDVNGDGHDDFIVGNYRASPNGLFEAGSAYVYSGADGSLLYQVDGNSSGERLGSSVFGGRDVNDDGRPDFITGSPYADSGSINEAGKVIVYSGADGTVLFEKTGLAAFDHFGTCVGMVGDLNADGKDEFLSGAPTANPGGRFNAGSVYVYSGADGSLLYQVDGAVQDDYLGVSAAGTGDINGDDTPDFIIGAPYADPDSDRSVNAGAAYVFSGLDGSALYTVKSDSADDYLGFSVAGARDVNADGRSDFIVGAPNTDAVGRTDAGWAGIYSGLNGTLLFPLMGDSVGDLFGRSVAGIGDMNGDGNDDVIIGAIGTGRDSLDYAGSARVISGADGSTLFQIDGSGLLHEMGYSVAATGDVNGDGRPDFIASAPLADSGRGEVFVYGLISTDAPGEENIRPARFGLSQNYPNPFNPATTIRYFLYKREKIMLEVFNLLGERIRTLANEEQPTGDHKVTWDGKDQTGKTLPSGIYFYRLRGKDFAETKKMLLLK